MDKHSVYYKMMEALQNARECPFCKLEEEAQYAYLDAFLYEAVNDRKVRAELVRARGYCHRHAHCLMDMRDKLGSAIIYQDQVKFFMELMAKKSGSELKRKNQNDNYDSNCPVCRNQMETRQYYLTIVSAGLREPEMKQAYESSSGFCIPHLAHLLETIKDPVTQDYLYQTEQRNLAGLWNELQEFIRKNDYRFRDESFGSESDSWRRAIKKMTGSKENF